MNKPIFSAQIILKGFKPFLFLAVISSSCYQIIINLISVISIIVLIVQYSGLFVIRLLNPDSVA